MAYSYIEYVGTGGGTYGPFTFASISLLDNNVEPVSTQLAVYRNGTLLVYATDYSLNLGGEELTLLLTPLYNTDTLRIVRETKIDSRYIDYVNSTNVTEEILDLEGNQLFYLIQETKDIQTDAMVRGTDGQWDARSLRIENLATGVLGTDAVNLNQLNAATNGALPAVLSGIGTLTYVGNSVTTSFPLPSAISTITDPSDVEIYINGLRQRPTTHYTLSGTNVVITPAPTASDTILMAYLEGAISAILTTNSVTTTSLQNDSVTAAKIAPGTNGQVLASVSSDTAWTNIDSTYITGFNTSVRTNRLDQLAVPTANVSLNSNKITNLATPTAYADAATKAYVDLVTTALGVLLDKIAVVYCVSNGSHTSSSGTSWTVTNFGSTPTFTPAAGGIYMGCFLSFNAGSGTHNSAYTSVFQSSSTPTCSGTGATVMIAIRKT